MSNQRMRGALEQIKALTEIPFCHTAGDHELIYQIASEALSAERAARAEPVGQLCESAYGRGQVFWFAIPSDGTLLYTAPKPEQQEAPAERECRHCGFLCRPNPAESRKWYPLEQAEPSGNPGEFAAPDGEQVGLTDAEILKMAKNSFLCQFTKLPVPEYQVIRLVRGAIAAHEAKRNGGAA